MPRRKLKVYMCYATEDKPIIRGLYARLRSEDWISPWLDEEDILPGQDKKHETKKALDGADLVTVCFSSKSINNKGPFQKELKIILDKADEQPDGVIFVIPVQLDEECKVPVGFERYGVFKHYDGEASYQALRTSLLNCARALRIKVNNISVDEAIKIESRMENLLNHEGDSPPPLTIIRDENIVFIDGRQLEMFFDLEPQVIISTVISFLPAFLNIDERSIVVRYFAWGDRVVIELPDRSARDFLIRAKSEDPILFDLLKLREYHLLDTPIASSV